MLGLRKLAGVRLSYIHSDNIEKMSVTNDGINNVTLYSGDTPIYKGLYDSRMGTLDYSYDCETCLLNKKKCPGHSGHIKLFNMIINPITINITKQWLKVLCFNCGEILVSKNVPFNKIGISTVKKKCPNCGEEKNKMEKYKAGKENLFTFIYESNGSEKYLTPSDIYKIFAKVDPDKLKILNLPKESHPSLCVLKNLYVPPPTIRPALHYSANTSIFVQDITVQLQHIVNENEILKTLQNDMIGHKEMVKFQKLVYETYIAGQSGFVPSLLDSIKLKKGIVRKNLLGKTSNNMGRNTISGNNFIKIDEVGIPVSYAKTLQIPEVVTELNYKRLEFMFKNGKINYPGASKVKKKIDESMYDINKKNKNLFLEIGDFLYRDLIDGDLVILNRQPSLERGSIGAHKVKILNDNFSNTFEMNVIACGPYNADFDGDQMNILLAFLAFFDILLKLLLSQNFNNTKNGLPVYGTTQDSNVGVFELTRSDARFSKECVFHLLSDTDLCPTVENKIYTGREVASFLFEDVPFNYTNSTNWYHPEFEEFIDYKDDEKTLIIKNGKILSGVLDKRNTGPERTSVFYSIFEKYGSTAAMNTLYQTQQMASKVLELTGYTISVNDITLPEFYIDLIKKEVSNALLKSEEINKEVTDGKLIPPLGVEPADYFEEKQLNVLRSYKISKYILSGINPNTNGLAKLILIGSKGNMANLQHIHGCVGQKTIKGSRLKENFTFGRVSPYSVRFSDNQSVKGFCTNAYSDGMTIFDIYSGSSSGRRDLVVKANETAVIGHLTRQMTGSMGSVFVDILGIVRFNTRLILSLIFSDVGFNPIHIKKVKYIPSSLDVKDVKEKYFFGVDKDIFNEELKTILDNRLSFIEKELKLEGIDLNYSFKPELLSPVNINNLYDDYKDDNIVSDEGDIIEMLETLKKYKYKLPYFTRSEILEKKGIPLPKFLTDMMEPLIYLINSELCSNKLRYLKKHNLQFLLDEIEYRIKKSLIMDENIGTQSCTAIAQPLMQTRLDSHTKSVGGEVENANRPREILDAVDVDKEKAPIMFLRLKDKQLEQNKEVVQSYASKLENITLMNIIKKRWILFENFNNLKYPKFTDDKIWIDSYLQINTITKDASDITKWCMRILFDNNALLLKDLDLPLISSALKSIFHNVFIVYNQDIGEKNIMRIYLMKHAIPKSIKDDVNDNKIIGIFDKILEQSIIGIKGIVSAKAVELKKSYLDADNNLHKYKSVYGIETLGTNILGVSGCDFIDENSIVSSSIDETIKCYGVGLGKNKIISELSTLFGSESPLIVHLTLAAQIMLSTGTFTSFKKKGIKAREKNNIPLQIAIESPHKTLSEAALKPSISDIYGLHGPMVFGAPPLFNKTKFVINEEMVKKNVVTVESTLDLIF